MEDKVFDAFYEKVFNRMIKMELRHEQQRQDMAVARDAAKIAGELTELYYQRIHEVV